MEKLFAALKDLCCSYNLLRIKTYIKSLNPMHVVVCGIGYFICLEILPRVTLGLTFFCFFVVALLFVIREIL